MTKEKQLLLKLLNERIGVDQKVAERFKASGTSPTARAEAKDGVLYFEGPIVAEQDAEFYEWWYGENTVVTRGRVRDALDRITGDVMVRMNSPGGDVWEGSAIRQMFMERQDAGDKLNVIIEGLCASAATFIIASADRIEMTDLSSYMIHRISSFMYGDGPAFVQWGSHMKGLDETVAGIYAQRMEKDLDDILQMMSDETWFTASEALESGIIDAVAEGRKKDDDDPDLNQIVETRNARMSKLNRLAAFAALPTA